MLAGCVAQDPQSFAKGKALFQSGLLSEAVLALEAEVQRRPDNVDAWRLLGTVHAENDDDQQVMACAAGRVISERERCLNVLGCSQWVKSAGMQAIAALNKALAADPHNAEVLLSLGVSYTNELDQGRALGYLSSWLAQQPSLAKVWPCRLAFGNRTMAVPSLRLSNRKCLESGPWLIVISWPAVAGQCRSSAGLQPALAKRPGSVSAGCTAGLFQTTIIHSLRAADILLPFNLQFSLANACLCWTSYRILKGRADGGCWLPALCTWPLY